MSDFKGPDIGANEILRKIKKELDKRGAGPHDGGSLNKIVTKRPAPEEDLFAEDFPLDRRSEKGGIGGILWKYGTMYASVIKRIPWVNNLAEKYYWKLSRERGSIHNSEAEPLPMSDSVLLSNLQYAGFLIQAGKEGLKGKIKLAIFHAIGFFAWWQGQVNRALYEMVTKQRAQIEDLEYRLSVLSRAEDALYQELTELRAEVARQHREAREFFSKKLKSADRAKSD